LLLSLSEASMKSLLKRTLTVLLLVVAAASSARAAGQRPADHVTADVVSVDAVNRTLVIRISGDRPRESGSTAKLER
jgi:hypothetical protein